VGVQLGVRLTRPAPLAMEELLHLKSCLAFKHAINRPSEPVGQYGEGFALAICILQASQAFLPCRIMAQEQRSSFGKSPFEVGIADLVARGAQAFTRGLLRTVDQAAIRDEVLHPGETVDVMDFIAQHQGSALTHPRDGAQAVEGVGIVLLGALDDGEF
jgi:hypothetical protein